MSRLQPIDNIDLLRARLFALAALNALIRPIFRLHKLVVRALRTFFIPVHLERVVDAEDSGNGYATRTGHAVLTVRTWNGRQGSVGFTDAVNQT